LIGELTAEDEALKTKISKTATVKEHLLAEETRRGLLVLSVLVVLDVVIAVVGAAYVSQSALLILSNLLFLEGALAFAVGSFVALARGSSKRKETEDAAKLSEERAEEYLTKSVHMPFGPLLMLLGAVLIALSVVTSLLV
jgi:dolichol kinase